jgi:hypothetical protein
MMKKLIGKKELFSVEKVARKQGLTPSITTG